MLALEGAGMQTSHSREQQDSSVLPEHVPGVREHLLCVPPSHMLE